MEGKAPDEIIQGILDSQQDPSIIEGAKYMCHMENVVKILVKYGEAELAELVQKRLTELRENEV